MDRLSFGPQRVVDKTSLTGKNQNGLERKKERRKKKERKKKKKEEASNYFSIHNTSPHS